MAPKKRKAVGAPIDDGDGHRATNKRIRNRASPSAFVKIYETLTVDQKAAVVTMELDSMLDIKCFYLHSGLIKWLASLYDPSSHEFVIPGRERIPLDDRSAFRTLGLPIGNLEVFYGVDSDAEASLGPTLFPDDVSTPFVSRVCELLMEMTASDDKFKQLFLMFLVSTILRPTTRNRVSNRIYRVMVNIDNVTNLNWCKFVVDELHNALSERKFNKGCLFHLQLLYVDSLDTSGLDIDLPEGRYAVNIWSAENIDKVLAADLNRDGTYGKLGLKPEFGVNHSLFGGVEGFDRWFNTNSHPACPNQHRAQISNLIGRFASDFVGALSSLVQGWTTLQGEGVSEMSDQFVGVAADIVSSMSSPIPAGGVITRAAGGRRRGVEAKRFGAAQKSVAPATRSPSGREKGVQDRAPGSLKISDIPRMDADFPDNDDDSDDEDMDNYIFVQRNGEGQSSRSVAALSPRPVHVSDLMPLPSVGDPSAAAHRVVINGGKGLDVPVKKFYRRTKNKSHMVQSTAKNDEVPVLADVLVENPNDGRNKRLQSAGSIDKAIKAIVLDELGIILGEAAAVMVGVPKSKESSSKVNDAPKKKPVVLKKKLDPVRSCPSLGRKCYDPVVDAPPEVVSTVSVAPPEAVSTVAPPEAGCTVSVAPPLSDAGDVSAVVSSVPLVSVATEAVTTIASRVSYDMTGFVNASTLFENYVPPTVHADMQSQGESSQVSDAQNDEAGRPAVVDLSSSGLVPASTLFSAPIQSPVSSADFIDPSSLDDTVTIANFPDGSPQQPANAATPFIPVTLVPDHGTHQVSTTTAFVNYVHVAAPSIAVPFDGVSVAAGPSVAAAPRSSFTSAEWFAASGTGDHAGDFFDVFEAEAVIPLSWAPSTSTEFININSGKNNGGGENDGPDGSI